VIRGWSEGILAALVTALRGGSLILTFSMLLRPFDAASPPKAQLRTLHVLALYGQRGVSFGHEKHQTSAAATFFMRLGSYTPLRCLRRKRTQVGVV